MNESDIITKLITDIKNEQNKESVRRSSFWALGQISSSDTGLEALLDVDFNFIEWCTNFICQGRNFPLRGTAFYCLGLLSRSTKGAKRLRELNWITSPLGGNSAVTIPQNMLTLFQYEYINDIDKTSNSNSNNNNNLDSPSNNNSNSNTPTNDSNSTKDNITIDNINDIKMKTITSAATLNSLLFMDNSKRRLGLSIYFKKLSSAEIDVVDLIIKVILYVIVLYVYMI